MDYKSAGVDVEAGYKAVELMKDSVKSTFRPEVLSDIGGFGALFSINNFKNMEEPVLVSGTDGVGTKLKIAFLMDIHDTVGIDVVAMCVNDIICSGAQPLFFLDYIACGKNYPEKVASIVRGISKGCVLAGCSLIGGETAEMPGFYPDKEYDLAGFAVGILDRPKAISGTENIKDGDVLIGISSSGIHSNGYSLVRKILEEKNQNLNKYINEFGKTIGEELLTPTKIYVKSILELASKVKINGISHITGGGFFENLPRILPEGLCANIYTENLNTPPIFQFLSKLGSIEKNNMFATFNMGVGMVLAISKEFANEALNILLKAGEEAFIIGDITKGEEERVCLK